MKKRMISILIGLTFLFSVTTLSAAISDGEGNAVIDAKTQSERVVKDNWCYPWEVPCP